MTAAEASSTTGLKARYIDVTNVSGDKASVTDEHVTSGNSRRCQLGWNVDEKFTVCVPDANGVMRKHKLTESVFRVAFMGPNWTDVVEQWHAARRIRRANVTREYTIPEGAVNCFLKR